MDNRPVYQFVHLERLEASLLREHKHFLGPTLIDSLRSACPSLQTLRLFVFNPPDLPHDVFPKLVSGLRHLAVLSCRGFALPDGAL